MVWIEFSFSFQVNCTNVIYPESRKQWHLFIKIWTFFLFYSWKPRQNGCMKEKESRSRTARVETTLRYIYSEPCFYGLLSREIDTRPRASFQNGWFCWLLTDCWMTVKSSGVENFRCYLFSARLHNSSRAIQRVCPLLTLRHSFTFCFWNPY